MWVPPIQRSMPRSSTRSASPRSVRSPVAVSRSWSRAKRWLSPSGGGGGSGVAGVGFEEPGLSLPERREGAVEPGVAEERARPRVVAPQRTRREACGRRRRPPGVRIVPSARARPPARAAPRATAAARGRETAAARSHASPTRPVPSAPAPGERPRRSPPPGAAAGCRLAARGPERLELARRQLAQTGEGRLAGEGADDDQLGRGLLGVGEREHVEELELVVEVVLEPEHDLHAVAQRLEQLPVAPLER